MGGASNPSIRPSTASPRGRLDIGMGWKLALAVALPILLLSIALVAFFTLRNADIVRRSVVASSSALATVLARNVRDGLEFGDQIGVKETLNGLRGSSELTYAVVRDRKGEFFAGFEAAQDPQLRLADGDVEHVEESSGALHVVRRVDKAGQPLGTMHVGVSVAHARDEALRGARVAALALLLTAGLGGVLGLLLGRYFGRPVRALAGFASSVMATGDLTRTIPVVGADEVGLLARSLRDMLASQRNTVIAIRDSADSLTALSRELVGVGNGVSSGFVTIQARVDDSAAAITRLSESLRGVAANAADLRGAAQGGGRTIVEVAEASRDVLEKVKAMRTAVESTSAAVGRTAVSIRVTGSSVAEVSTGLDETVTSMSEIAQATAEVQHDAADTAKLSEATVAEARAGGALLKETLAGIDRIGQTSTAVSAAINALVQSSSRISEMAGVISDVTNQTNLLAINASIIAAQAGEQGRGFSVVADEIKALSDRTRVSTGEISALADEVQTRSQEALAVVASGVASVRAGIELGQRADHTFERIVATADETSRRMNSVAEATARQAQATERAHQLVDRISQGIHSIEAAARDQTAGAEAVTFSAEQMKALTGEVHAMASRQSEGSQRVILSITEINQTAQKVDLAVRAQERESALVNAAAQAIAAVTREQTRSVEQLQAAIATLETQVVDFQRELSRFHI